MDRGAEWRVGHMYGLDIIPPPEVADAQRTRSEAVRQLECREAIESVLTRAKRGEARAAVCVVELGDTVTDGTRRLQPKALCEGGVCRHDDVVVPYHGGVVVAAGPFAHPAHAEAFARKLATHVARLVPRDDGRDTHVETRRVGLAIFPNHGLTSEALLKSAAKSLDHETSSGCSEGDVESVGCATHVVNNLALVVGSLRRLGNQPAGPADDVADSRRPRSPLSENSLAGFLQA